MVSIIALIATLPLVVLFLVLGIAIADSFRKRRQPATFFLMLGFICIGFAYMSWTVRILLLPDDAGKSDILIYFQLAYVFNAFAGYFICLFGVSLGIPELLPKKKWLYALFLIPVVVVLIPILAMTATLQLKVFTGITDLGPDLTAIPFLAVGILSLLIPIFAFVHFLREGDKNSFQYRRAQIILIGLVIVFAGLLVDAMKLTDNIIMVFIKLIFAAGAFILLYGFKLMKEK